MSNAIAETTAEIWVRTLKPDEGNLPVEAARFFLGVNLAEAGRTRLAELSAKARDGSLSPEEDRKLDLYLELGWFLDSVKSKARLSLRNAGV
ncbi:MAG TPA: hypothetical protein VGK40_12350 [Verrucomicrobiae bacterium]|jgi:hypothetical protein